MVVDRLIRIWVLLAFQFVYPNPVELATNILHVTWSREVQAASALPKESILDALSGRFGSFRSAAMEVIDSNWAPLAVAALTPLIGGWLTAFRQYKYVDQEWYTNLPKPKFTPAPWLFPLVWSAMYVISGFASYLVWRDGNGFGGAAGWPLIVYGAQLLLNWAWMPIFFTFKKRGLAAVDTLVLSVAAMATMVLFKPMNRFAYQLFIPYVMWIMFAAYMSISIWFVNRDEDKLRKRKAA
uniref:TspO/MBR family protein n=1 Tax=Trichuris muris TaxID=70415 RepID=A0A5S6QBM3_TRIMR